MKTPCISHFQPHPSFQPSFSTRHAFLTGSFPFVAALTTLHTSPLRSAVPVINGTLISKRMGPQGSPNCKTVKISPIIKLCLFSSFEKLLNVTDFWEAGNKSAASVTATADLVRGEG